MKIGRLYLLLAFFAVYQYSTVGQAPPKPASSPVPTINFLGTVTDGRYVNQFFDLDLQFPKDWKVADSEMTSAVLEIGTDFLKGENEKSNRALEAATKREVVLLYLTRKPLGSPGNCSFIMAVLKQPHDRVLPSMVAEASKALFENSPNLKLTKDTRIGKVGGQSVAMLDYEMTAGEQRITILYYVAVVKGYAVSFSITFTNDDDRKELEKIVSSIAFDRK